jgi:hypothetical protein
MHAETDDFEDSHAKTDLVSLHLSTLSQLVSELPNYSVLVLIHNSDFFVLNQSPRLTGSLYSEIESIRQSFGNKLSD